MLEIPVRRQSANRHVDGKRTFQFLFSLFIFEFFNKMNFLLISFIPERNKPVIPFEFSA